MTCAVVEGGLRCPREHYILVRDPSSRAATRHPICMAHFQRAFYRAEILWFWRPPRVQQFQFPANEHCNNCGRLIQSTHAYTLQGVRYVHVNCQAVAAMKV